MHLDTERILHLFFESLKKPRDLHGGSGSEKKQGLPRAEGGHEDFRFPAPLPPSLTADISRRVHSRREQATRNLGFNATATIAYSTSYIYVTD